MFRDFNEVNFTRDDRTKGSKSLDVSPLPKRKQKTKTDY